MDNILFTITCTTCQTKLAVRDAAVVGDIVACPKCESMVHVTAPKGWIPPNPAPPAEASGPQPAPTPPVKKPPTTPPASQRVLAADDLDDTVTDLPQPALRQPPPLPTRPASPPAPPAGPQRGAEDADEVAIELPPIQVRPRPWWQRKPLLIALAGVILLLAGTWYLRPKTASLADKTPVAVPEPALEQAPAAPGEKPPPLPAPLDPRWLPGDTKLVVQMQLARVAGVPGSERLIAQVDPIWQAAIGPMMTSLGLTQATVHRLTWASVDLMRWPEPGVFIVELEKNQDARALARAGKPAAFALAGVTCRSLGEGAWPHPFAVLNEHVIVTGREALLRALAGTEGPALSPDGPLARLALASAVDPVFAVRLDLTAARAATWRLPDALFDVWPSMGPAWRSVWQQADGVAMSVCPAEKLRAEVVWTAGPGVKADALRTRLDELRTAAVAGLTARIESLAKPPTAASAQVAFLTQLAAALRGAKSEVADSAALLRAQWEHKPAEALKPGLESQATLLADWLAAAWSADEAQHRRLGKAVTNYVKAETHYPSAVAGHALVPPETRLSWIAALLPYLDQADWHRQLAFEYSWDSAQNQPVAKRTLGAVVNPILGPTNSAAGYPVTHYVGVAGVGADGPTLPANHPRAGVFGYGRATLPAEIPDGAAHTIAILGVTGRTGPWAAGGNASVRPLTKAPYFQGPDGFGSGQPHGMFAGMADGSVRFLSKDTDPKVLEQLATIRGAEQVNVAALWPEPAVATPPAATPAPAKPPPAVAPKPEEMVPDVPAADQEPEVDVETRLAGAIPAIAVENTSLLRCVRLVSELSGLPITLDLDAVRRKGVKLDDTVRVKLSQTTVRDLIEAVVAPRNLALSISNNQVLITSPPAERETLRTTLYDVSDLVRAGVLRPMSLAQWMQELVAPTSWKSAGGQGQFVLLGEGLSITQTDAVHSQILRFLECWRTARGLPLKSRADPGQFALTPAFQRAKAALATPVTFNFRPARPLERILRPLEDLCQATLLVDWSALAAANVSAQVKGAVAVEKQPLSVTLDKLLTPLGLVYRVVDAQLIEITSRKALGERLELEFYPVAALMDAGRSGEMLIEQLRTQVDRTTWAGSGGHGVVRFDEVSKHLLVLQSQPMQAAVARFLAAPAAKAAPPANNAKPTTKGV